MSGPSRAQRVSLAACEALIGHGYAQGSRRRFNCITKCLAEGSMKPEDGGVLMHNNATGARRLYRLRSASRGLGNSVSANEKQSVLEADLVRNSDAIKTRRCNASLISPPSTIIPPLRSQAEIARTRQIDLKLTEFTRLRLLLEQDVQLHVREAHGFGEPEPTPRQAHQCCAGEEEARLALPVPGGRVQHARRDDVGDDADDIVRDAREDDGFHAQTRRGDFGNEDVADRADGEVICERQDDDERSQRPGRAVCFFEYADYACGDEDYE